MKARNLPNFIAKLTALFALTLLSATATAQTYTLPIPPLDSTIDANGVDLQTGFVTLNEADLSIGDPAHGGLQHTRSFFVDVEAGTNPTNSNGTNAGWRHGYIMSLTIDHNTGVNAAVAIGNVGTVTFTLGTTWTPDRHNGWSLVQSGSNYIATGPDGTIYNFSTHPNGATTIGSYYGAVDAVATSVVKPNGEIITLSYQTGSYNYYACSPEPCTPYVTFYMTRLMSVQNNYGYQLHYYYGDQYLGNMNYWSVDDWAEIKKVEAINLSHDYCDPLATSCTGTFPAVTYSHSSSGWTNYTTVTKPGGGTRMYSMGTGSIEGGSELMIGIRYGSSTSDNVSYNYYYNDAEALYTQRVISVVRNGVEYDYSYVRHSMYQIVSVKTGGVTRWSGTTDVSNNKLFSLTKGNDQQGFNWGSYGRLNSFTAPGLPTFNYAYDSRGNTTSISYNDGISTIYLSQASFPSTCSNPITCNRPTTTTNTLGKVTSYSYDSVHGGVLTVTSPAAATGGVQPQQRTTYTQLYAYYKDATGAIVAAPSSIYQPTTSSTCITTASCAGTADEVKTTIAYGATGVANNLMPTATAITAGDGSVGTTTTVAYDIVGNKASEDGPLAGSADTTTWTYNADRQVTQVVGPDPDGGGPLLSRSAKTTYNDMSEVTSVSTGTANSDGTGFVELRRADTGYDSYYRKIRDTVTASGSIQSRADYSYDALERPLCTAVRMNPAVFATATTDACTLGTQGTFGPDRISHNVYDSYDRITKVQTAYGLPYQRDEITKTYGLSSVVASVADAKGNLTSYAYDTLLRLAKTNYPSPTTVGTSSTTDYEALTYDAAGHVTNRRLRDGKQISYTYDNLGRQTLAHMVNPLDANDRDIATSYDLLGRATQVDDGNGKKVSFAYDQLGRKLSESPQLTGGSTTYQYDAGGRRTRLTWSDGFYVAYDYDTLGEMLAVRENGATSGVGVLASFAYDDQGKPVSVTRGNGVNDALTYDAASRLASFTISHPTAPNTYSFAYNPASQLISRGMTNDAYAWTQPVATNRNYTTNGLNQYTASGTVVPTYDGRGNTTSAGPTTFTYDSKNQLNGFGSNGLGYDAQGRLATQTSPATRFVYDGSDLIAETDASNAILRRYVHVPGTDNVIVWYEGAGTTDRRWLEHDERLSSTLITDASGTSLGINTYDEYGNNTYPGSSGTTNLGRFQYTGQTWLPELGMYNYKARIYSPSMGRFMQADPTGYDDGPNWYNYVHGDPINGADPSGTVDIPPGALDAIKREIASVAYGESIEQIVNAQFGSPSTQWLSGGFVFAKDQTPMDPKDFGVKSAFIYVSGSFVDTGYTAPMINSTPITLAPITPNLPQAPVDVPCMPGANCKLAPQAFSCTFANNFCKITPAPSACSGHVNGEGVKQAAKEGAEAGFGLKVIRVIGAGALGTLIEPGGGTVVGVAVEITGETAAGAGAGAAINYLNQKCGG